MAPDEMILMRENPLQGPLEGIWALKIKNALVAISGPNNWTPLP
jgi:hypothetical protein